MEDYVIAVRTFDRTKIFIERTYKMLSEQEDIDLKEKLFIFVANEEEQKKYMEALGDRPYNKMIIAKQGGKEAIDAISDYFDEGQNIVFLDDDHKYFFEWTEVPSNSPKKDSKNLLRYIKDAIAVFDEKQIVAATFGFNSNYFFVRDKPFKEIRPTMLNGCAFIMKNDREIVKTMFGQCDDLERTCKVFEKYGPILLYNWTGFETQYGVTQGGMQSSGDRGDKDSKFEITKQICEELYDKSPVVKKYANPPKLDEKVGIFILKIKNITAIDKLIRPYERIKWPDYFGPEETKAVLFDD